MDESKEAKLSLQSQLGKESETSKIRRDELDYDMLAPPVLSTLAIPPARFMISYSINVI